MKKLLKIMLAIGIMMAFCLSTSNIIAQEWSKEQLEVWNIVKDSWAKWAKGDVEGSIASIHEKYQGWSIEEPLPVGKAKLKEWYSSMKDMMKIQFFDLEPARIVVTEDAAVVDYYFSFYTTYTWGEKTTEKEIKGKNAEFWVKEKGKWLLLGDMTVFKEGGE